MDFNDFKSKNRHEQPIYIKEGGSELLKKAFDLLKKISDIRINLINSWSNKKLDSVREEYNNVLLSFYSYNECIDYYLALGTAEQNPQIRHADLFNIQNDQIQRFLSEIASVLSSKSNEVHFCRSLVISIAAIIISIVGILIKYSEIWGHTR